MIRNNVVANNVTEKTEAKKREFYTEEMLRLAVESS